MMRTCLGSLAVTLAAATSATAQVAPDEVIRFSRSSISEGIQLLNRTTGVYRSLTNVPASVDADIDCGTIDPATGDLIVGDTTGEIVRLTLLGAGVTSGPVISTGLMTGASAVALDADGNVFVCAPQEIYRFDRASSAATHWDSFAYGGNEFNAMTIDPATNRMWAVTFGGLNNGIVEWDLSAGPGAGTQIVNFDLLNIVAGSPSGVSFDGDHTLYISDFTDRLFKFDLLAGLESLVPNSPTSFIMNGCWVDKQSGNIVTVDNGGGGFPPDGVFATAPAGGTTSFAQLEDGTPSAVAINDFRDLTTAYPATAVVSADFQLELAAHADAGNTAAIFITEIDGIPMSLLLGYGTANSGGLFKIQVPITGGTISPNHAIKYRGVRRSAGIIWGSVASQILIP